MIFKIIIMSNTFTELENNVDYFCYCSLLGFVLVSLLDIGKCAVAKKYRSSALVHFFKKNSTQN